MNVRPKCSFGRGKTPTDADRSLLVGVQELLPRRRRRRFALVLLARVYPRPILLLVTGVRFCFMNHSGQGPVAEPLDGGKLEACDEFILEPRLGGERDVLDMNRGTRRG